MRIISEDPKKGIVRLKVEDVDDLWTVKNVIKEGDIVIGRTLRDVKLEGEGKRRRPMKIAIKVKNTYFQPFATRLRVHGIIVDAPEGYGLKGSHHTLNIDVGTEFEIKKEEWSKSILNRLKRATRRRIRALLVAVDFDEASIGVLQGQGIKYLVDLSLPGLSEHEPESLQRIVNLVSEQVANLATREGVKYVVIGSPVVLRELIVRKVNELNKDLKVYSDSVSVGGRGGIEELIRRDKVKNLLKEMTAVESEEILNQFMAQFVRNPKKVAIGIDEVSFSIKSNAASKLLVHEEMLTSNKGEQVEAIINDAEIKGAKVLIVPREAPSAKRLKGLGGLIALLRYPLDLEFIREKAGKRK